MTYRALVDSLRPVAEAVKKAYFKGALGISDSKVLIEGEIHADVRGRPTLQAMTSDHQIICVEISENPYPPQIDPMAIDCKNHGLPVQLFVGIPDGQTIATKLAAIYASTGVGLMIVENSSIKVLHHALSLSLTGVRDPESSTFPAKYRQCVTDAHRTFLFGDPAQAPAVIYQEIEDLTRRLAVKTQKKGWFKKKAQPANIDPMDPKIPFKSVAKWLAQNFENAAMPNVDSYLLDRVVASAGYRNDHAHKPKSLAALKKRHSQLRTRFETAADLLRELSIAAKPI